MEVGVEISQKIRSAIKAKLMELGCYVDDELPDYIMVMVANKKTRAQMSGDLSLFLGTNTDTFTEWLHGLLVKLQAINTESSNQQSTDKNEKSKSSKKKEKSKKSDSGRKDKDKKSKKSDSKNIDLDPSSKNSVLNTEKERSVKSVTDDGENAHSDTVHVSNSGSKEPAPSESSKVSEDVEDVRQLLVTETTSDALAEELETTETEVVAKESREVKVTNSTKVKSNVAALSLKSGRRLSRSKSHSPERPAVSARKRKTPISVVSSVSRPGNDDEEEYDPHNPSVGSVASVVKVTNRKSSVPPALQANREEAGHSSGGVDGDEPPAKVVRLSGDVSLSEMRQILTDCLRDAHQQNDEIALFTQSVEKSLRTLSPDKFSLAKLLIQQALYNVGSGVVNRLQGDTIRCNLETHGGSVPCCQNVTCSIQSPQLSKNHLVETTTSRVNSDETANKTVKAANSEKGLVTVGQSCVSLGSHVLSENRSESKSSSAKSHVATTEEAEMVETLSSNSGTFHDSPISQSPSPHRRLFLHSSSSKPKVSTRTDSLEGSSRRQGDRELPSSHVDKGSSSSSHIKKSESVFSSTSGRVPVNKADKGLRKANQRETKVHSPVSSSRREVDSPHSTESCPPSSTSGLDVPRRCIVSTSGHSRDVVSGGASGGQKREQVLPLPMMSPRASSQSKEQPFPSFLVDSIHSHRRPVQEASSVLKQGAEGEKAQKGTPSLEAEEAVESFKPISSEALRVMAKNLKITVINKRAIKPSKASSSESSSEESDDGSSDDEEEEEESEDEKKGSEKDCAVKGEEEVQNPVNHSSL